MGIAKPNISGVVMPFFFSSRGLSRSRGLQAGQHILMRRFKISDEREIF